MCLTGPFKFNESDVLLGLESKRVRRLLEDGKHVTSNSVEDPHYRPLSCNSWSYRLRPAKGRSRAWVKDMIRHSTEKLEHVVLIMILWSCGTFQIYLFLFWDIIRCSDVQTVVFFPLILSSILRLHPNRTVRGVAFSVSALFPLQEWHMPFYLFCFPLQLLTKREVYIIPHKQSLYIFTLAPDNAQQSSG